jgi:hypothetical protein
LSDDPGQGLTLFTPLRYNGHSDGQMRMADGGLASFNFEFESNLERDELLGQSLLAHMVCHVIRNPQSEIE